MTDPREAHREVLGLIMEGWELWFDQYGQTKGEWALEKDDSGETSYKYPDSQICETLVSEGFVESSSVASYFSITAKGRKALGR